MFSTLASIVLAVLICGSVFGQTAQTPAIDAAAARFEIADVHVTPKALANTFMEANPPRNGRYEFHSAAMIDLIELAYGFDFDRILGGPSWLEMDRFEVIAKVPPGTKETVSPGSAQGTLPDAVKEMLQSGGDPSANGAGVPTASDPNGGMTIIEALDKQLGFKLETQKRPMPVAVIDYIRTDAE